MLATATLALAAASTRRLAVVTGGTRGLGRGIAEALARDGHDLVLTYHSNATAAREAVRALAAAAPDCRVSCVAGDIARRETRDAVFAAVDAREDATLAVCVHNAGQYLGATAGNGAGLLAPGADEAAFDAKPDGRASFASFDYYIDLYGEAYVDLCERSLARMDDGGALIGLSSPGNAPLYKPQLGYDLPGSGKCVMEYATRLLARRGAPRRVTCNVVVPGVTPTEAWARLGGDAHRMAARLGVSPTTPAQVGSVVAFLCSDAGRVVTGVTLPADGGVHLVA
jgi:NAD(P)-dependent dehydrogenase (short-subunit alcohol dehydrogenase family)